MLNNLFGSFIDKGKLTEISLDDLKKNVDPTKKYYAELKPKISDNHIDDEWNNKNTNIIKKLIHYNGSKITAYTCRVSESINDTRVVNNVKLEVLPLKYDNNILITNYNTSDHIYKNIIGNLANTHQLECNELVKNEYAYEEYAENYNFYTDKTTTGGKRSKSRRQKRSAKKSRKHRKPSKK